jgi:hypothetical protein
MFDIWQERTYNAAYWTKLLEKKNPRDLGFDGRKSQGAGRRKFPLLIRLWGNPLI